jgi:putative spermidine/putrescine transport system substrate-binding protein
MDFRPKKIMRRITISLLAASVALFSSCSFRNVPSTSKPLTIVSYGGDAYQRSHKKAFIEPYSLYTGFKLESTTWSADYGKLKAMVQGGKPSWDVVEVTAAQLGRGIKDGLYERFPLKIPGARFVQGGDNSYGVPNIFWGTVLGYRKAKYDSNPPRSWKDFFDIQRFPGARALYDDPRGNLEFALLSDGVPIKNLYPLDVDRAFKVLDRIKPHIRVWWSDSSQPLQLLSSGSVVMSSLWNGRIFASKDAKTDIGYTWTGAALELDYWVIPRGSINIDHAARFIAFASNPYSMAVQAEMIGYGPANQEALRYVSPEVQNQLPTSEKNWKDAFVIDAEWWAQNEDTVKTRWLAWKAR